jgi:hypothetical protein
LDDGQRGPPITPPGQPHQSETRRVRDASWLDVVLLVQGELLAQEQILSCQSRTRTEAEAQEARDIKEKREQRTGQRHDRTIRLDRRGIAVALLGVVSAHLRLLSLLRAPVSSVIFDACILRDRRLPDPLIMRKNVEILIFAYHRCSERYLLG